MTDDPKSFLLTPALHEYIVAHCPPLDPVERSLIEATRALGPVAIMQISPEQGAFLGFLARVLGARHVVEVGTFTGYSTLCLARALPEGGRVLACDLSEEWTAIGREHWRRAGVDHRIDLRLGPAAETLAAVPAEESFDLAFIDADKTGYGRYYEEILARLRPGGVIAVDNVLWSGQVADPACADESTMALREFNDRVAADPRVECVMLPLADGVSLLRKRETA